jgi:hypothetical protein
MLADRDAGLGFEGGKRGALDHAGQGHELIAGGAVQMVVMRRDQLEAGAPVVEHHFAQRPVRYELFGGTKDRGEIRACTALGETPVEVLERPRMVLSPFDQGE